MHISVQYGSWILEVLCLPSCEASKQKKALKQRKEKSKNTNKNGLWLVFSCCPSPKYSDVGPKIIAVSWEGQDFVVFQF